MVVIFCIPAGNPRIGNSHVEVRKYPSRTNWTQFFGYHLFFGKSIPMPWRGVGVQPIVPEVGYPALVGGEVSSILLQFLGRLFKFWRSRCWWWAGTDRLHIGNIPKANFTKKRNQANHPLWGLLIFPNPSKTLFSGIFNGV